MTKMMFINKTYTELELHYYDVARRTSRDDTIEPEVPLTSCVAEDTCPTCPKRFGPIDSMSCHLHSLWVKHITCIYRKCFWVDHMVLDSVFQLVKMPIKSNNITSTNFVVCWSKFELLQNRSTGNASRCKHLVKKKVSLDMCFKLAMRVHGNTINYKKPWCNVKRCKNGNLKLTDKLGAVDIYVLTGNFTSSFLILHGM